MNIKKLSIVVPVFNEAATLPIIYKKLQQINFGIPKEIVYVDDGSTDGSVQFLKRMKLKKQKDVVFLFHQNNSGKGAAIQTALRHLTGSHVVIQDADLEYDPRDIRLLLTAASKSSHGVVYGSRNKGRGNSYIYPLYFWGGRMMALLVNVLFGQKLTDPATCYKMMPVSLLRSLRTTDNGFGAEIEMTCFVASQGIAISEVSVSYNPRSFAEGKKIRLGDGLRSIYLIVKCRLFANTKLKSRHLHDYSLQEHAVQLHKDVPPDWYETSVKTNILQRLWHKEREKHIRKYASVVNGSVLDIGCADGYFSNIIAQETQAKHLVGVDVLPTSVAYAKKRYRNNRAMSFSIADAHKLPFKAHSFSGVFSIESLEHVLDPVKALAEMKRVTSPNGYAMVLIPTENLLFTIIWFFWTKSKGRVWKDSHVHTFEPSSLPDMLKKAGFRNIESHYFLFGMLLLVKGYNRPVRTR